MPEQIVQRLAVVAARLGVKNKQELAKALGVGRTTLHYVESGTEFPSDQFLRKLERLEHELNNTDSDFVHPAPSKTRKIRSIGVVGWAHAGCAATYEEVPKSWQETITTNCRDPKAIALKLEGDSMEDYFFEGDRLTVMPSEEPYSGCFVVCKFKKDDGVLFRRFERAGDKIVLVPLNKRYEVETFLRSDFEWIYPVYERQSQLWKR